MNDGSDADSALLFSSHFWEWGPRGVGLDYFFSVHVSFFLCSFWGVVFKEFRVLTNELKWIGPRKSSPLLDAATSGNF